MERFEKYCTDNVRCDENSWIRILRKKLSGDTLAGFEAILDKRDSYIDLKVKLLKWDHKRKSMRKKKAIDQFKKMKFKKGEQLYLFSSRLEKTFRLAYPKENVEKSTALRDKFVRNVPKGFANVIREKIFCDKVWDKTTRWNVIQRYAQVRDAEDKIGRSSESSDSETEKEEEIVINIQQQKDSKTESKPNHNNKGNGCQGNVCINNNTSSQQFQNRQAFQPRAPQNQAPRFGPRIIHNQRPNFSRPFFNNRP